MTRFRVVLIVAASPMVCTLGGRFLYKAVGLDSPVGTCSPVGNSSPIGFRGHHGFRGQRGPVGNKSPVGNNSPVGSCSPLGTQTRSRIANSLSGGGQSGQVIPISSGTAVTDVAMLS